MRLVRRVGAVLGLFNLIMFFLVPFFSNGKGYFSGQTLYDVFNQAYGNLDSGNPGLGTATFDILVVLGGALILAGGFLGIFPYGSGILSLLGVAFTSPAPLVQDFQTFGVSDYAFGFLAILTSSAAIFVVGFLTKITSARRRARAPPAAAAPRAAMAPRLRAGPKEVKAVCVRCRAPNPAGTLYCTKCGASLH